MKRFLSLIVFAFVGATAFAQQAGEAGDVAVSLDAVVRWYANIGSSNATATLSCFTPQGGGSVNCTRGSSPVADNGNVVTPKLPIRLVPGVTYYVSVNVDNGINTANYPSSPYPGAIQVKFRGYAPAGYTIDFNHTGASQVNLGLTSDVRLSGQSASICLRPVLNNTGLPAGMAKPLSVDRVLWQLSLGNVSNGTPAGQISINALASSTTLANVFTRTNLFCDAASSDVLVIGDAANQTIPRQVIAPQVCVDIVGALTSGNVELKCYHPSQRSANTDSNGYYSFTGDPFSWYIIQPQGTDAAGVSILNDLRDLATPTSSGVTPSVSRTTKVTRTGTAPNFTWTAEDWHDVTTTALTKTTRVRSGSTETITVKDDADVVAATTTRTYTAMLMGEEITAESVGSINPVTTNYTFYSDEALNQTLTYGRLKSTSTSSGNWQAFEYDAAGQVQTSHGPFGNSDVGVPSGFPTHSGVKETNTYSGDPFGNPTRNATSQTTVNGVTISKSTNDYVQETPFLAFSSTHNYLGVVNTSRKNYYSSDSAGYLASTTKYFAEDVGVPSNTSVTPAPLPTDDFLRGQIHAVVGPDGVASSYAYQRGTWNGTTNTFTPSGNAGLDDAAASRVAVITGTSINPGGTSTLYSSFKASVAESTGYPVEPIYLIDGKSTLDLTFRDQYANVVRTESQVWSGGAWNLVSAISFTYNLSGQLTNRTASNGAVYTAVYAGDRKTSETDESGVTVSYTYDVAGRTKTVTKSSGPTNTFTYDAAGHVLSETLSAVGTAETLYSSHTYDDAGRVLSDLPVGMAAITHSYNVAGRSHTVTYPDGGTRTEYSMADGKTDHVDGSAALSEYYTYTIETDGRLTSQVNYGSDASPRWQKKTVDWLDRPTHSERPGYSITSQAASSEDNEYEAGTGHLIKTTRTGLAPNRYSYDAMGQVYRTGLDIGDNGLINASADRISESNSYYEKIGSDWWMRNDAKSYPKLNDATLVTTATTRKRLTGHPAGRLDETQTTDAENNVVTRTVDVNRATATTISTTTRPGVANTETSTTVNGLATSATGHDGLGSSIEYDSLNRAWRATDSRGNKITTTFKYGTTMAETVVDGAANTVATISYDNMGRQQWTKDGNNQYTRFAYNQRGQLTNQWGGGTYPVSYGYDSTYGERTTLSTYRNAPDGDSATWPSVGVADTTNWTYDGATGLLWKKTDAVTQVTEFDYNSRGQTSVRKWARKLPSNASVPVTTTYGYDGNTGELLTQTYNDQSETIITPNVTYTYTRLGQVATVSDGTGSRIFGYNATSPWQQDTESLDTSFYASRVLTRNYDTSSGTGGSYGSYTPGFVKGRYTGYDLGVVGNAARDQHVGYTTSNLARFVGVTTRISTGSARDYVYSYQPSSRLLAGYAMGSFAVSRGYETLRDLLTSIQASWNGTSTTRFDYNYNPKGQRYTAKQGGSAFADYSTGAYNNTFQAYKYNARGELETSAQYGGDTVPAVGTEPTAGAELPGRRYEFRYDSIGNRKSAGSTGNANTGDNEYATNSLNQYTGRENNTVRVTGTVAASATVNVGGAPTSGKKTNERVWGTEIVPNNAAGPVQGTASVYAVINNGDPGTTDQIKIDNKTYIVPKAWQVFTYDADGNMTSDGIWLYTYDAENRLVRMVVDSVAVSYGLPNRTLFFSYDYQGRRVEKRSINSTTGTDVTTRFLYDGYNLIAETNTSGSLLRQFTWGLDITGGLTAAGSVGALLQIDDFGQGKTLAATYDGNGNIAALVNLSSGATEAAYEYNSFGELLRADGAYAKLNPFRFSTKWQDDESGLINYGFRYYSPTLGRFINRDPIEEKGGLNLYGFCGNDGVNHWDYMGNSWLSKLWSKFKHKIISIVIRVVGNMIMPGLGEALSKIYDLAIAIKQGGLKGVLMSYAGQLTGPFGKMVQSAAKGYSLYQQFGHGKFLNNLGNYVAGAAMGAFKGDMKGALKDQWTNGFSLARLGQAVVSGISHSIEAGKSAVQSVFTTVVHFMDTVKSTVQKAASWIGQKSKEGIGADEGNGSADANNAPRKYVRSLINIGTQAIRTGYYDNSSPDGQKGADGCELTGRTMFLAAANRYASGDKIGVFNTDQFINYLEKNATPSLGLFNHSNDGMTSFDHENITPEKWGLIRGQVDTIYLLGCLVAASDDGRAYAQQIANATRATVYASPFLVVTSDSGYVRTKYPNGTYSENNMVEMYVFTPDPLPSKK